MIYSEHMHNIHNVWWPSSNLLCQHCTIFFEIVVLLLAQTDKCVCTCVHTHSLLHALSVNDEQQMCIRLILDRHCMLLCDVLALFPGSLFSGGGRREPESLLSCDFS